MGGFRGALVAAVTLASLAACGDEPGAVATDAPITSRAVAVIALDHLSATPISLQPARLDDSEGTLGADLGFPADDDHPRATLRVTLMRQKPQIFCQQDQCHHRDTETGSLWLSWTLVEPEEDPGAVNVTLVRPDESVVVHYSGDDITGDPRGLDLPITVEQLEEIAQDPRLTFTTTEEIVAAGEALGGWGDSYDEPSDEPAIRRVPADGESLAAFWRTALEWAGRSEPRIRRVRSPSPAEDELGLDPDRGDLLSARITLAPTDDRPFTTLDLFVTEQTPAQARGPVCPSRTFKVCLASSENPEHDTWALWDPGRSGVVWVLYQRDDTALTARLAGWDVPEDTERLREQVDWDALMQMFAYRDFYGFWTTPEFADQTVP